LPIKFKKKNPKTTIPRSVPTRDRVEEEEEDEAEEEDLEDEEPGIHRGEESINVQEMNPKKRKRSEPDSAKVVGGLQHPCIWIYANQFKLETSLIMRRWPAMNFNVNAFNEGTQIKVESTSKPSQEEIAYVTEKHNMQQSTEYLEIWSEILKEKKNVYVYDLKYPVVEAAESSQRKNLILITWKHRKQPKIIKNEFALKF